MDLPLTQEEVRRLGVQTDPSMEEIEKRKILVGIPD
jgi:hypothetical protein